MVFVTLVSNLLLLRIKAHAINPQPAAMQHTRMVNEVAMKCNSKLSNLSAGESAQLGAFPNFTIDELPFGQVIETENVGMLGNV